MRTNWIKTNYPYFLTGIGVSGMFAAIILGIAATPKADKALREKREAMQTEKLPAGEILKTIWRPYFWTALTAVTSAGCVVGGSIALSSNFARQRAAIMSTAAAAISSSEGVSKAIQEKVAEKLGKDEAENIKEEAVKEVYHDRIVSYDIFAAKARDEEVYFEPYTGQWFVKTPVDFLRAKDILNTRMYDSLNNEILLHELFHEWGLEQSEVGWMLSFKSESGPIDYDTIGMVDEYGRAYQYVNYVNKPTEA